MSTTTLKKPAKKPISMTKLNLEAEARLIRAVKERMETSGEPISAEALRKEGLSEAFIKRFLAA